MKYSGEWGRKRENETEKLILNINRVKIIFNYFKNIK